MALSDRVEGDEELDMLIAVGLEEVLIGRPGLMIELPADAEPEEVAVEDEVPVA